MVFLAASPGYKDYKSWLPIAHMGASVEKSRGNLNAIKPSSAATTTY